MPIQYVHTNLVAVDWKKLANFYIQVFDCQPVPPERNLSGKWLDEAVNLRQAHIHGIHLRLPGYDESGPTLEIFSYQPVGENYNPQKANQIGFGHLAFAVEDVSQTLNKVLENGGNQCGKIIERHISGAGTILFVYCYDPEGNLLELQSWKNEERI